MQAIEVDYDQVGLFAYLQRADLMLQAERTGTVDGCHLQHSLRRHDQRVVGDGFMDNGCQFHFTHQVVVIVAGAAITAQRDVYVTCKHLGDFTDARGEFAIRGGIVRDAGARFRKFIDISLGEPDHVYQHRFRAEQSHTLGVIDGREPIFFIEEDFVGFDFSQVHGDTHVALVGVVTHFAVEFRADTSRGTRAKPDMNAVVGGTVPFAMHIEHTKEAGFAAFDHARVHGTTLGGIGADVHDDTSEAGTNTAFIDGSCDTVEAVTMGQHRFEEGGGAGFQHFGDTQARADIPIIVGEIALQDPYTVTQPLYECHVIGTSTNQRLSEVDMRVDQARKDHFSFDIDDLITGILAEYVIGFANCGDAVIVDGDCTAGDNVSRGVHGDDGGVGEKHILYPLLLLAV